MTTWYVKPDSTHNTVRDGTTYRTAWGSFTEVVWASLLQGDTLYVCGAHYPVDTSVNISGASTGGSLTNRLTLLGNYPNDPGSITLPNGGNYTFTIARNYVKVSNLTVNSNTTAAAIYLNVSGTTIENCTITTQASSGISIEAGNGAVSNDITIRGNTFSGSCGTGTGSMVRWRVTTAAAIATLNRLSLINNTFINCQVARTAVTIWVEPTAGNCVLTDVVASQNKFINVQGGCLELAGKEVHNYTQGLKVLDNIFQDCTEIVSKTGGGCISVIGWGQSTTAGFGVNVISGNKANNVIGAAGLINVFYGTYLIEGNFCDGLSTSTIDACGILLDRGNKNCVVRQNTLKNLYGVLSNTNSLSGGTGILILNDNTGHRIYSNTVENCSFAVGLGDAGIGQTNLIVFNNTFSVRGFGIYLHATSDPTNLTFKNNFISGTGYKVYKNNLTSWTLENYNAWQGMTSGNLNHTLGANDITTTNLPLLDTELKKSSSLVHTGSFVSIQTDAKNTPYFNPPSIGAYEYVTERADAGTRGVR